MAEIFTAEQVNALKQTLRNKYIKIEVLDFNKKILGIIEGYCVSGSLNLDATSLYRRSANLQFIIDPNNPGKFFNSNSLDLGGVIWLNKYLRIYVGIENFDKSTSEEITWYNLGIFIINNPSTDFTLEGDSLTLSCCDIMMRWGKDRAGQLASVGTQIPQYTLVEDSQIQSTWRNVIINTLNDYTDIKEYYIAPIPESLAYVPEDINFSGGVSVDEIFTKILEYLPDWEMYFDIDGVFRCQPIPSGENDIVFPFDSDAAVNESSELNYSNVKNHIIVYGKTHDINEVRYTEDVNISGNYFDINFEEDFEISNNTLLEFYWPYGVPNTSGLTKVRISMPSFTFTRVVPFYNFENIPNDTPIDGNYNYLAPFTIKPFSLNVIRIIHDEEYPFPAAQDYVDFISNSQTQAYSVDVNPNSPFYINNVLTGVNYASKKTLAYDTTSYRLYINNTKPLNSLGVGTELSFIAETSNTTDYPRMRIFDNINGVEIADGYIGKYDGTYFKSIGRNAIGSDYTVWYMKYLGQITAILDGSTTPTTINAFEFQGRLPTLTYYLEGGEYENIYSNELAKQRADYELKLHSNYNNSIALSAVPDYTLDVNKKIKYKNEKSGVDGNFLIKSISMPLGATGETMSLSAIVLDN